MNGEYKLFMVTMEVEGSVLVYGKDEIDAKDQVDAYDVIDVDGWDDCYTSANEIKSFDQVSPEDANDIPFGKLKKTVREFFEEDVAKRESIEAFKENDKKQCKFDFYGTENKP